MKRDSFSLFFLRIIQDGFGPFSDAAASSNDGFTYASSFSDEDSSFESFGDFGDFQSADEGDPTTPTTGSWTFAPSADFGVGSGSGSVSGVGAGVEGPSVAVGDERRKGKEIDHADGDASLSSASASPPTSSSSTTMKEASK